MSIRCDGSIEASAPICYTPAQHFYWDLGTDGNIALCTLHQREWEEEEGIIEKDRISKEEYIIRSIMDG